MNISDPVSTIPVRQPIPALAAAAIGRALRDTAPPRTIAGLRTQWENTAREVAEAAACGDKDVYELILRIAQCAAYTAL